MKMQKSVLSVEKNLKINMRKIEKLYEFRDHCHYTGKYRGAMHNICDLK